MNALFYAWVALNLLVPIQLSDKLVHVCEINSFRDIVARNAKTTEKSILKTIVILSYPGVYVAHEFLRPKNCE